MSKFLTPPVWYDKNGNLNEMLTGNAGTSSDIAIGSGTTATGGGIAIGHNATAGKSGCIVIGDTASASEPNTIQLGNNSTRYALKVGNGESVINGYIEKGIYASSILGDNHGFVYVSYSKDGNYVKEPLEGGIYIVRVEKNTTEQNNPLCTFLFEFNGANTGYSSMFEYEVKTEGVGIELKYAVIKATPNNTGYSTLSIVDSVKSNSEHEDFTISVRLISQAYAVG